jgi:hypothetical protein
MIGVAQLLRPFRPPREGRVVPRWVPAAFLALSTLLVPWVIVLVLTLPDDYTAAHWRLAWGGFDIALAGALFVTALLVQRRSPLSQTAAAITATLLFCDAWFDVLTSRGRDVVFAALLAVFAELPLALVCLWIARGVERVLEDAQPYLRAQGFTIRYGRLVPPQAGQPEHGDPPE